MKKNLYIGIAALAALTLSSCQREADFKLGPDMVTVTLTADKAGDATRAAANEGTDKVTYTWTDEDITNLKLFKVTTTTTTGTDGKETTTETLTAVEGVTTSVSSDNRVLSITATVEESSTLRAIVSSGWTSSATDPKPKVPAIQKPASDNFDPNADILVADDVTVTELNEAKLNFQRPVTVNKMTLKGLTSGETVSKVVIASSDKTLTGYYDYATENMSGQGQSKEITIKYEEPVAVGADGEFPVYFVAMPNEGHTLSLTVETVKNSKDWRYTKELSKTVAFTKGKFSRFNVTLSGCGQEVVDEDYTGEWIIAGTHSDKDLAATDFNSEYKYYYALEVDLDAEHEIVTVHTETTDAFKKTFTKITEGTYAGFYTIKDADGKYLSAQTDAKNYLIALDAPTEASYWTITKKTDAAGNVTYDIQADKLGDTARKAMRINYNNGSYPRLSCYATSSNLSKPVLYPYAKVISDYSAPAVTYKFKKVSAVTSGKKYLMVGYKANSYHAAVLWTGDNSYGYMKSKEVTPANDIITEANLTDAITIAASGAGYSMQMSNGKYIYADGDYKTLNYGTDPSSTWTIAAQSDGTFEIKSEGTFIQYGEGTYTSFGRYSEMQTGAVMPFLYELEEQGGTTPTYSITIDSNIEHGTVTANMTSGIEGGESIIFTITPDSGYELETIIVDGENKTAEVEENVLTYDMPDHDVTVTATFKSTGTVTYDFTTVAELNALVTTESKSYSGKLTDAVVSFVPAANTAIIKDATGSVTYYKKDHGLLQGQSFSGDLTVDAVLFNGYSEITSLGSASFTGEKSVVEPATVTLSALNGHFAEYQNAYVKVENLTVTSVNGKYIYVTDGTNNYVVYLNFGNATCSANDVIAAVGTITKYNGNEQIKVWTADDLTAPKTVTFAQPTQAGCSITVSVDGSTITTGATVAAGKVVSLAATAGTDFTFVGWTVSGATVADASATATTFTMGTSDVTISATFKPAGGSSEPVDVTYDFTNIDGFADWGTSYSKHIVNYEEATVTFDSANKQSSGSTITNMPVTKGQPVSLVLKYGTLNSVTFNCAQWGTKAQTITLHYSTDGGNTYTSAGVTSTNFTISSSSLPAGTNAVKITFSSTSNQVGIESATINYTPGN